MKLGKTVGELKRDLADSELADWLGYFAFEARLAEQGPDALKRGLKKG